ncbi:MAG TPA: hypothetical protein VMU30_05250 [Bacteroidota bacterium]|nr:hypothetical protein [Bacteroidota bacterium]
MSKEAILEKGVKLCAQINDLSELVKHQQEEQSTLVVSFDVYCALLEYTVYLHQYDASSASSVEDFLRSDDLVFEANNKRLDVRVDFFLPANSIQIQ